MASSYEKSARLVIIEGKDNRDKGKVINLKKSYIIIGRGQADIVLNDLQVSRAHVALEFNEKTGELTFTDLGSTNGTLVNNELRKSGVLKDRDRLKVGHTVFDCQLEYEAQTEVGTSAQLRQEPPLSQSKSFSLAGPSKFSSESLEVKSQPPTPSNSTDSSQPPKNNSSPPPVGENIKLDVPLPVPQKFSQKAKVSLLAFTLVAFAYIFLSSTPNRSVSNKNLKSYTTEITELIETRQLEQAKTLSLEAIKAFPSHSVPMFLLGNVHEELKQFDLAIDTYRRSLALKPFQLITHIRLARLYLRINKKDEAKVLLADLLPVLDSTASSPQLHIQIGELFLDYPDLETKELLLKRAKNLQTKDAPNDSIGYKLEANVLHLTDKSPETPKKVEELLKKGLSLAPKDEWIFDRVYYLKSANNNKSEAINTLEDWIKANPRSTRPLIMYSYLKFNDKKFLEAIPYLQKIMNLLAQEPDHPDYAEALNLMGNISMQQNQLAEAENFFRQSCRHGFKASCSHPLIIGIPLSPESPQRAQQESPEKVRQPGSINPTTK